MFSVARETLEHRIEHARLRRKMPRFNLSCRKNMPVIFFSYQVLGGRKDPVILIVLVLASRDCKTREKNPSLRIQRRIIALINSV